jgi:hypothetical protein
MARQYKACLSQVRGSSPPVSFLDELVDWAITAPDALFAPNAISDIYSSVMPQLGPYGLPVHRKAVMLEVLRVLPGHESTWNWNQGVDAGKTARKTSHNEETGAFQVSADSMELDKSKSLENFVQATIGATDDATFIARMKSDHKFAIEYVVRLLRINIAWNGPISRRRIHGELKKTAVTEFRNHLQIVGDFAPPPPGVRYA